MDAAGAVLNQIVRDKFDREYGALAFRLERLVDDRRVRYLQDPGYMTAALLANAHRGADLIDVIRKRAVSGYETAVLELTKMVELMEAGDLVQIQWVCSCAAPPPD